MDNNTRRNKILHDRIGRLNKIASVDNALFMSDLGGSGISSTSSKKDVREEEIVTVEPFNIIQNITKESYSVQDKSKSSRIRILIFILLYIITEFLPNNYSLSENGLHKMVFFLVTKYTVHIALIGLPTDAIHLLCESVKDITLFHFITVLLSEYKRHV